MQGFMKVYIIRENRVIIFIIAHYKFYNVYYKIDYKTSIL
jgi:hypothetical protein